MKRIISIISTVLLAACSDDISLTPGISFLTPEPEIFEETAIFRVIGQPFSDVDSLVIPVTFSGSAKAGIDYEASASHFVFKGEDLTDSIVIHTKQLGTGRSVGLSLHIPEGFVAGKYITSEFVLQNKYGLLNFDSSRGFIADTTSYTVALTDSTGKAKVLSKDAIISFCVNTEKSTAIEGLDFEFIDLDTLRISAGNAYTGLKIAPIGDTPKEGRDKIVLSLASDYRFDLGKNPEIELSILRSELKVMDGNWMVDTLLTDSLHFEKIWGEACSGYSLVPEYGAMDSFGISFLHGIFSPAFQSGFRNFFIGDSNMSFGQEMEITDVEGQPKKVQLLSLDKTNRYFSESESSADSLSYVGIHLYQDDLTQSDRMELYLLDHTSKSFMPELESGNKYGSEKPVATNPGTYMCARFRKL